LKSVARRPPSSPATREHWVHSVQAIWAGIARWLSSASTAVVRAVRRQPTIGRAPICHRRNARPSPVKVFHSYPIVSHRFSYSYIPIIVHAHHSFPRSSREDGCSSPLQHVCCSIVWHPKKKSSHLWATRDAMGGGRRWVRWRSALAVAVETASVLKGHPTPKQNGSISSLRDSLKARRRLERTPAAGQGAAPELPSSR
jgi:hypothetical protein